MGCMVKVARGPSLEALPWPKTGEGLTLRVIG